MKERISKKWVKTVALLLCEAAAAVFIAYTQGFGADLDLHMNARYLSDGCFVTGMLAVGLGALIWISTTGFFDIMSYGVVYGLRAFIGLFGANRKPNGKDFYTYKLEKDEKRGKPRYVLLITGIAFIAVSAFLLFVYYG